MGAAQAITEKIRILVVGGDSRVLEQGEWPPWYEIQHIATQSGGRQLDRVTAVLRGGRIQHVIVLMKWKDKVLLRAVKQAAKCKIHYWPNGIGELQAHLVELVGEPAPTTATTPPRPASKPAPRPVRPQPHPLEAPPPPPEAAPEPPAAEEVAEPPRATEIDADLLVRAMTPDKPRSDSWTRDELIALVCAWQEAQDDGDIFIENCRMLGLNRSVTSIYFATVRASTIIGRPLADRLVQRLRKLGEGDRKKATLAVVEMIERDKGSTAVAVPTAPEEPVEAPAAEASPVPEVVAIPPAPSPSPAVPPPASDDHFRLLLQYEVLSVRLGKKSMAEAFAAIAALVLPP